MKKTLLFLFALVSTSAFSMGSCVDLSLPTVSEFNSDQDFVTEAIKLSKVCDDEATLIVKDLKTKRLSGQISYVEYRNAMNNEYLPLMNKSSKLLMDASLQIGRH